MRTDGPATTPPPDLRVGDYRLLARIGEGGMGVVHLAEAPDGRRLALKVLRPHVVGDDESRERLAREVSSLSRVRSPWVAEIVDADPWGPMPYVATRYVPGPSLHQHVRQHGPLAGGDLTMLAGGLAEATAAVHAVGVLHRDVKPSNVLLEGRRPVLIDFGLARLADDPRLTATGWLLGTPGYLAPEVLYGDDPTPAADVHAWAATVVFAATGRPPYGTGPAMAVMDRTRRGEHDLRGVPEHLVPLLRDALAADPHQRPTLPEVLGRLRRGSDPDRPAPQGTDRTTDQATMPIALALHDEDQDAEPTDVWDRPDATRPLTAPVQQPLRPVAAPQRAPYEQPAPPRERLAEPVQARQPRSSRLQRSLLLGGLAALVALWFAAAPYLTLAGVAAATWLLRTWSWTSEASQDRVWRRGRRRWYDGLVSTVSAPWYLLVASAGTLLLLLTATLLASLAGLALLVLGAGTGALLTVAGAVLVGGLWWGPGARRVRRPTRRSAGVLTSRRWSGWAAVLVVATLTLLAAYLLSTDGTSWQPMPGAPWRSGTLLGRLSGWL